MVAHNPIPNFQTSTDSTPPSISQAITPQFREIDYGNNVAQRTLCVLVLDLSGSMAIRSGNGDKRRIDMLNEGIEAFYHDLMKDVNLQKQINLQRYISAEVGLPTLTDIIKELAKPGRDPREQFEVFSFAEGVNSMEDLRKGMKLSGIVTNITNFGAFVDIGVHQDGLVHTSQLANHFVANPNDIVKVSQVVQVTVVEVDIARKRISLSMKTENSSKVGKTESPRVAKPNLSVVKAQPQLKEADGDLHEKLAKLKGMFK